MYVIPGVPLPYHMCGPVLPCHVSTDVSSSCHMCAPWRVLTLLYVLPDRSSLYHACYCGPHSIICVLLPITLSSVCACMLPIVPSLSRVCSLLSPLYHVCSLVSSLCHVCAVLISSYMWFLPCPRLALHVLPAMSSHVSYMSLTCLTCDCQL